jgi:hypothetical protein
LIRKTGTIQIRPEFAAEWVAGVARVARGGKGFSRVVSSAAAVRKTAMSS